MSGLPQRELGIEDVISRTLTIYRDRFAVFFAAFLVAYIPGAILGVLMVQPLLNYMNSYMTSQVQVSYPSPPLMDDKLFGVGAVLLIVAFLVMLFADGFAIVAASSVMKGDDREPTVLLRGAYGKYLGYLKASMLLFLGFAAIIIVPSLLMMFLGSGGVIMGAILLLAGLVAGVYLYIRLSLYPQAYYLENVYATESLGRSYQLLKGRVLVTLVLIVAVWLISLIPSVLVGQVSDYFTGQLWFVGSALGLLASALAAPIGPIALTVWYYSMKARESPPLPPAPPTITVTPS